MATTHAGARKSNRHRIAPLTPDSPDPDARADANNPALLAALEEARRQAREPGGRMSQEEIEAKEALTPEEEAAADALSAAWEAERMAGDAPRRRPSGRRPNATGDVSGRLVVRFPKSIYRELAQRAGEEGVSLNQLVIAYVSRCLGAPGAAARS
jgi:predicted HicB family RNase H-like nuclease